MATYKGPGRVRKESAPSSNLTAPLKARLFNYDVGDAKLKDEHQKWLAEHVIPFVRSCRHTRVNLTGTASRTGTDHFNLQLSERRARGIVDFLEQNGAFRDQIKFLGLGEAPAKAAGKKDETETDEDRAVVVEVNPPAKRTPAHFERVDASNDEDGFDPFASPRFLMVPASGGRRTLELHHAESLRLRTTNPFGVQLVDPITNLPVNELIVCGDRTRVTFEGRLPGESFIVAEGVNGGRQRLLEVHTLLHQVVDVDVYVVKDSTGRQPTNRSRKFVEDMLKDTSRIWRDQANISFRLDKFEDLKIGHDLGVQVTNKETSAGKNFHILSDKLKSPKRINVFLVWEWNPDDGNADAEVDRIGGKFIIFEDKLSADSTPGRVLGHEIGHLLTLEHDDVVSDVLMWGGAGLPNGRLRKDEILKARKGI